MTSTQATPEEVWGPMAQPIKTTVPDDSTAVYRDNVYATFWDPGQKAFFTIHSMTTPNGPNPMARVSAMVDGVTVEFVEPVEEQGTHNSKSLKWDHAGRIVVDHPELALDVTLTPRLIPMDDAFLPFIPESGGPPINHYERTVDIEGSCTLKGREVEISGTGYRDRSIGFRDESLWNEYVWFFATFPDHTITCLRMVSERDNFDRQGGFLYDSEEARKIDSMGITRDPSGLFAAIRFNFEDGEELSMRTPGRDGGFWIPMGWEREGPTLSVYQEFIPLRTAEGLEGYGQFEQAVLRQIY